MPQPNQHSLFPQDSSDAAKARALKKNSHVIKHIEKQATKTDAVLGPCLRAYLQHIATVVDSPIEWLDNLSRWLIEAKEETSTLIRSNMTNKWPSNPENIEGSVSNSSKRSAGTNYQSLVAFALAKFLVATESAWYVEKPVPQEFSKALTITFTANDDEPEGIVEQVPADFEKVALEAPEELKRTATVQPDVDILLRNAGWDSASDKAEPVVLLSVKTSLVDRSGQAARWKLYFDLATRICPLRDQAGCVYEQLGIQMENANKYVITHGIVTANIYKYWFHDQRYKVGELASGQTQSNTFMFELKLTTRNDEWVRTPRDWKQFPAIDTTLKQLSRRHGLPE